jgi:hypothetical protein
MEDKKENEKKNPTISNTQTESSINQLETEEPTEEKIPEYEIKERLTEYGDWKFYIKDGKAYLAGYTGEDKTSITIPRKISSYDVAGFTEGVCWYNKELKSVIIEEGIKEIPINAFIGCENLEEVKFPTSLKTISANAFKGCSSLKVLTISKNIETIADSALAELTLLEEIKINSENKNFIFENGILYNKQKTKVIKVLLKDETIELPNTVREIGSYAFSYNDTLKTIVFPISLSTINNCSFYYCNAVETIHVSKGLKDIKPGAFYKCNNLQTFTVETRNQYYKAEDGILYSKDKTKLVMLPPAYKSEVFALPETTIYIESYAFIDCKINTFIIHKNIARVNSYAFVDGNNTEILIKLSETSFKSKTNLDWNKFFDGKITYQE